MSNKYDDNWLLPARQHDHPAHPALTEPVLHGRREATFLVLAGLFFTATTLLLALGTGRQIDLARVFDLELPIAMQLPLGVLAFPVGLAAVNLVCDLYGRRRASVLVVVGTIASFVLVGCMRAADAISGTDEAFVPALALASCYVVAHVSNVVLFDSMRRAMLGRHRWLRRLVSTLLAQLGGWAAFAFVAYGCAMYAGESESTAIAHVVAVAAGGCAYAVAFVVVGMVPGAGVAKALAVYVRVGRFVDVMPEQKTWPTMQRVPVPASVLARPIAVPTRAERRAAGSIQAFTSSEMQFFTEGDTIAEAADSSGQLSASTSR